MTYKNKGPPKRSLRGAANWNLYMFLQIHYPMQFSMHPMNFFQ